MNDRGKPSWQQQASRRIFARSSPNGRRGEPSLIPLSPKVHLLGHDSTAEGDIFWVRSAGPHADAPRPFSSCSPAAPRRKMRDGALDTVHASRARSCFRIPGGTCVIVWSVLTYPKYIAPADSEYTLLRVF